MNLEEMKQVLKTLELCNGAETADGIIIYTDKEIASVRQAIEQAEKKHLEEIENVMLEIWQPVAGAWNPINTIAEAESQEPVAVWELQDGGWDTIADPEWMESLPIGTKLYTHPPKREWVPLTDDEIKEIVGPYGGPIKGYTRALFDKIDAKLRENNT